MQTVSIKSSGYDIELNLRSNITIITGDTGSGKSFLYDLIRRSDDRNDIICINYDSIRPKANYDAMVNVMKQSRHKIFVIDNADDIQEKDDSLMYAINTDSGTNTFIVIGRSPNLVYNISDLAEISIKDNKIELEYLFPEPLM